MSREPVQCIAHNNNVEINHTIVGPGRLRIAEVEWLRYFGGAEERMVSPHLFKCIFCTRRVQCNNVLLQLVCPGKYKTALCFHYS